MLTRAKQSLDRATWRQWGFDLSASEMAKIEQFFDLWMETYNRPGVSAFESQEALFGVEYGLELALGDPPRESQTKGPVSALRGGYCVAKVERALRLREDDPHLTELFRLLERDEHWPAPGAGMERALIVGRRLGQTAADIVLERPEVAASLPGFTLREAVFADLRHTLLAKLVLTSLPRRFNRDLGESLLRFGHAVGYAEEALPTRLSVV